MQDPAILRLRAKVRLEPGRRAGGNVARPPLIQITLADGTRLTQDSVGPASSAPPPTR